MCKFSNPSFPTFPQPGTFARKGVGAAHHMLEHYILDHHDVVLEPDLMKWARWRETADITVASTDNGVIWISTNFLGVDHNFMGGSPHLFETMTYLADGFEEEAQKVQFDFTGLEVWRWSTWEEADEGHWKIVRRMFNRLDQFRGPIAEVIRRMRTDLPVG